jgi:hypothetical protein
MKLVAVAILLATACPASSTWFKPDVTWHIILPNDYVGWVRIDFEDRSATELNVTEDNVATVLIPESGIARTSSTWVSGVRESYRLYYRDNNRLKPVSSRFYSHKWMLDGFSTEQVDASGKPRAISWYFFIGPKSLREKDPSKAHIPTGTPQPVPGRIAQ